MKKNAAIALIIFIGLTLWLLSGVLGNDGQTRTREETFVSDEIVKVRTRELHPQEIRIDLALHGRTEALRIVDVMAEIAGKVVETPVEKGEKVKNGDILCRLAEDDRRVQLTRAEASFERARIDYEGAKKLFDDGMISSAALAASKSALETERAELKVARLNVGYLDIRAPFDAYIEDRPAQVGALIERNSVCARLLDEGSLLASAWASEREVRLLELGQAVEVELVDGKKLDGRIRFIGRTADRVTRTYKIEAELMLNGKSVREGVTARLLVPVSEVMAHQMSPAVLTLDAEGRVGVRTVNDQNIVEFHHVDIVREDGEGIWVTGLPQRPRLITVGQELVSAGDFVETVSEDRINGQAQ